MPREELSCEPSEDNSFGSQGMNPSFLEGKWVVDHNICYSGEWNRQVNTELLIQWGVEGERKVNKESIIGVRLVPLLTHPCFHLSRGNVLWNESGNYDGPSAQYWVLPPSFISYQPVTCLYTLQAAFKSPTLWLVTHSYFLLVAGLKLLLDNPPKLLQ